MVAWKRLLSLVLLILLCCLVPASLALAAQSTSSNYSVDEVFFGNGGELNACSTNYCSKQSSGELGVGSTSSTNYTAKAGNNTNREEYLQFVVNATTIDLGYLNTSTAATGSGTFSVKAYLADGYQVVTASDPPTYAGHSLNALASQTSSNPGTEQFGINLVANTSPNTVGADPVQVPSSGFSYGTVATGYNTTNVYKYHKGDVVASSAKSTGETDYTVTYLLNISNVTPAGQYVMNHVLVATATF